MRGKSNSVEGLMASSRVLFPFAQESSVAKRISLKGPGLGAGRLWSALHLQLNQAALPLLRHVAVLADVAAAAVSEHVIRAASSEPNLSLWLWWCALRRCLLNVRLGQRAWWWRGVGYE